MPRERIPALLAGICLCLLTLSAHADIFVLRDGGEVRGELVNPDENPRKNYHVKTAAGGHVLLKAEQVKSIQPQTEAQKEYDRIRWDYDDTLDGQWQLAEWCRERNLVTERKTHLDRILELDPDHAAARRALGFRQIGGNWVTEQDYMEAQGYVRHKGRWRTRQEVELLEQAEKDEKAEKDWIVKIKRWRGWLNTDKAALARKSFLEITDPYAAKGLSLGLAAEKIRDVSLLYVESLANIRDAAAYNVLVLASLEHPDVEVRIASLDKLVRANYQPAVGTFVQKLKDSDNLIVNRAGAGLAALKDPNSVGPLIDALVTMHKRKVVPGGNPNQISTSFGTGGPTGPGGFSFGQPKERIVNEKIPNQDVLTALVTITGQNFNYDQKSWKYWYAAQKKPASLDARRDDE
jgi:hypothetical protein